MRNSCSVLIDAPQEKVYAMTSDLSRWPALLPHYRWVRWLEGGPDHGVLEMAALRGAIPISWTSEFHRDPVRPMLSFRHLKAFTKGMEVRWIYTQEERGVRVTIEHDLDFRWPLLAPLGEAIVWGIHDRLGGPPHSGHIQETSRGQLMMRRRAVITGVGPISCIGSGREKFWQGILAEKSGIGPLSRFPLMGLEAPIRR